MKENLSNRVLQPCSQWVEKLSALQLHDLTSPEKEETERHVATCLACSTVLEQYQHIDTLLKNLPTVKPQEQLPVHLLELTEREYTGTAKKARAQPHSIEEDKGKTKMIIEQHKEHQHKGAGKRTMQLLSTVAAVLVVAAIAISAFVLFSHRDSVASVVYQPNYKQGAVYYNPEIPGNAGRANIYAFNPDNGSVVWRTHLKTKLNDSLMMQYQGKLFAPGYDGSMYALDAYSGQILWTYSIKNDPVFPGEPQDSNSPSSGIVAGDAVYFGAPSGIYAVSINSGKLLWHKKPLPTCTGAQVTQQGNTTVVNGGPTCNIVPVAATKDTVFTYIDGLYALKASTGEVLWSKKDVPFTGYAHLAVTDGKVYIIDAVSRGNSCEGKLSILRESSGQVVKTFDKAMCDSSIVASKEIVVSSSVHGLTAIRSSDDTVLWQKKSPFDMNNFLAVSDKYAYYQGISNIKNTTAGSYDESYYALNLQTGTIQWESTRRMPMNGGIGSPGEGVVVNGKLCFFFVSDFTSTGKEGMFVFDNGKEKFYPLPADWQS